MAIVGKTSPYKKNKKESPFKAPWTAIIAGLSYLSSRKDAKRASNMRREDQERYEEQKEAFEAYKFTNPYEGVENPYSGLTNQFTGLENQFSGLQNNDWEDLTADKEFIYIADIGNNFDTRDNLRIIKVPLESEDNSFEIINYYYPEQKDFDFNQNSKYDAEGIISVKNKLLIFTKNRAKKITEIYKLPKNPGNYKAELIGQIDIESIVTASDYNEKLKLLVLTSTKDFNEYYMHKIKNFNVSKIKKLKADTFEIPIGKTQVEAIKIIDKKNFWITSEAELFGSPLLYKISL